MQTSSSYARNGGFFAKLPVMMRRLLRGLRRPAAPSRYRPEKHYMRGPGPKSRAGKADDRGSNAA
jgi:hypothetical protein